MKKYIAIVIAIIAIFAMCVPAMADVNTSVTILSGGTQGNPPDIVASWVLPDDGAAPGTQILPPLVKDAQKPVIYIALVDDRQGDSDVTHVDVDVWHPAGSPAPYNANNYLKYERPMIRYANFAGAQNPWAGMFEEYYAQYWFNSAVANGTITDANLGINPNTGNKYTIAEIGGPSGLINQESVGFWAVAVYIDYEQPAGTYPVKITATDTVSNISTFNYSFYYIPVAMVDFDFNAINFGKVQVNTTQEIDGDYDWAPTDGTAGYNPADLDHLLPSPAQATVRNIGNVWAKITVKETNLFDINGAPLPQTPGYNVVYDACVSDPGAGNFKNVFGPEQTVTLNRDLFLSETQKMDFSLDFLKSGQTGVWTGTMTLGQITAPDWPTAL